MNGIHDMGGMHGFGPVVTEPNEPVFHSTWEARVFALVSATGAWGRWNIDAGRQQIEQMPPADYLRAAYYEKWLAGLIEKTVGGELKSYKFVRADRMSSRDEAMSFALAKGRQIIDEQGEGVFGQSWPKSAG